MFRGLSKLSLLDLSFNAITMIEPGTLSDCTELTVLMLSSNLISTLHPRALPHTLTTLCAEEKRNMTEKEDEKEHLIF